jgi:MYXO-CTERM domain-containing protein
VASLANQATVLIKLIFRIDDLAPSPTLLTSVATVSTSANDTNTANDVATATVPVPQPPAAELSAFARIPYPVELRGGAFSDSLSFAFGVKNDGPGVATHVLLTFSLPPGIMFQLAPPGPNASLHCGRPAPDTITCAFNLASGGIGAQYIVRAAIPPGTADGTIFDASVKLTYPGDSNADDDVATISKCVQANYCAAGPCNANVAVECPDTGDPCATCNPITGACRATGVSCDDGDACTLDDRCYEGTCTHNSTVMCRSTTCMPKACEHATGECMQSAPTPDLPECAFPPKPPHDEDAGTEHEADASAGMPHDAGAGGTTAGADAAIADAGTSGGGTSHHGKGVKTRDAGSRGRAVMDAGVVMPTNDGCACRVHAGTRAPSRSSSFTLLGLLAVLRLRRRHSSAALSARSAQRAASLDDDCAAR